MGLPVFASETVFIQVRNPFLIKGQWINSSVRQPFWGLILQLVSVTSETLEFRGEGYELLQEKDKMAAHIHRLMNRKAFGFSQFSAAVFKPGFREKRRSLSRI